MNNINENDKAKLIGDIIKKSRKELGKTYTQDYISEKCGVDARQTISKWEKGAATPTIQQLYALCELFDCDIGYLLGEHTTKKRKVAEFQSYLALSEVSASNLLGFSIAVTNVFDEVISNPDFKQILLSFFSVAHIKANAEYAKRKFESRKKKSSTGVEGMILGEILSDLDVEEYKILKRFLSLSEEVSNSLAKKQVVKNDLGYDFYWNRVKEKRGIKK